jgi:RNA polymerase sigma-70 factor (ECF subfamily)
MEREASSKRAVILETIVPDVAPTSTGAKEDRSMSRDDHPHRRARLSPEEQRARLAELERVQRRLTADEAALLAAVFPAIVHAHHDAVFGFLRRTIAEADVKDAAQKTFIALHRKLVADGFKDDRPKLVLQLAYGVVCNHRKGKRREPYSLGMPTSSSEPPRTPVDLGGRIDAKTAAAWLIPQIPEEQQQVLELSLLDLTHEEIAAALDIPLGTVKSRLKAAKRLLRELATARCPPSEPGEQ